jgi:AraC-like DNA-binding protein
VTAPRREPALRLVQRCVAPSVGLLSEVVSLRRPEFALRATRFVEMTFDQRLFAPSYPFSRRSTRLKCVALLEGKMTAQDGGLVLGAGESLLLTTAAMATTRWEDAIFLDLEWEAPAGVDVRAPTRLARFDLRRAQSIAAALAQPRLDQCATLTRAFALFRRMGAPFTLTVEALVGEPSARDRRLAQALELELAHLASRATELHLGESVALSPRQLQRVVRDFGTRYHLYADDWRDIRNRWRLEIAAAMLSRPALPVAQIAKDVGYGSPNALARAFARAGLPSPAAVRRRLAK